MILLPLLLACQGDKAADTGLSDTGPLGGDRPTELIAPSGADASEPLPLVLVLGGYSYYAWELDEWMGLSARADADGFYMLLPDGTEDSEGWPFWNATDTCCDYDGSGVDDVAYLRALIDQVSRRVAIDDARISVFGHSNGAFMGYRLACEPDSPITGLVSVAGSGWLDAERCEATHPVSLLQVHGELDEVMPMAGDADAPSTDVMLQRWGERNGCDTSAWSEEGDQRDYLLGGGVDTTVGSWSDCGGHDVALWTLLGADHYPDTNEDFAADSLDFLLGHPL